jgi:thermitase
MVAGIVDQIAPKTKLLIAKVADSDGNATSWSITEGLAFAVTHGAEVANVSLGSPTQISALSDVMDWCEASHLLVVSPIGNSNLRQAFFPARISKVVCVAGLNPDNTKAAFSNWEGSTRSSAPATGIVSQWWNGQMGVWSGTSFASPMVAAALADCLRRTSSSVSLNTMRDAIEDSGKDIDAVNNSYRGELGTLLDHRRLNSVLTTGA